MFDIFITTNGPGEISTWVKPFVQEVKKNHPQARVSLFILPCRFSTGNEEEVALGIREIDYVFRAKDFDKRLRSLPFKHSKNGVIVFLGGDLFEAVLLKLRYKYKAIAYTEGQKSWKLFFNAFFLRDKDGDLMFSSLQNEDLDKTVVKDLSRKRNIVFFPGSRPEQFKHLFPLFQNVSKHVSAQYRCVFSISSYIPDKLLEQYVEEGTIYYKDKSLELMKSAYLAITIPGTNNIELAYLSVPSLIVFPFNYPEVVNFKGLIGAILNFPILKTHGKSWLLRYLNKKVKYTSLVNTKENKLIFPELRGNLQEKNIIDAINKILEKSMLDSIKENLKEINRESNVLNAMLNKVKEYAEK